MTVTEGEQNSYKYYVKYKNGGEWIRYYCGDNNREFLESIMALQPYKFTECREAISYNNGELFDLGTWNTL